jgi:predicted glutamine amidotransferase
LPFGPANVAPFIADDLAGVHNGWIGGFRGTVGRRLIQQLSDERHGDLVAMNDSLVLFLLVLQHGDENPGATMGDAVAAVVQLVAAEVDRAGEAATLNLVIASSSEIIAARTSVGAPVNSLYVRRTGDAGWVASEPLDPDDAWESVAEHTLVTLTTEGTTMRSLEHQGVR